MLLPSKKAAVIGKTTPETEKNRELANSMQHVSTYVSTESKQAGIMRC